MAMDKFLKVYANLPVPEREQVIAIMDGKTYSWNAAFIEVSNNTVLGRKIVKKLEEMRIL